MARYFISLLPASRDSRTPPELKINKAPLRPNERMDRAIVATSGRYPNCVLANRAIAENVSRKCLYNQRCTKNERFRETHSESSERLANEYISSVLISISALNIFAINIITSTANPFHRYKSAPNEEQIRKRHRNPKLKLAKLSRHRPLTTTTRFQRNRAWLIAFLKPAYREVGVDSL